MSYRSIIGQSSMALDKTRNKIYRKALKEFVTKDSVILDLGAGLGPFGLMAAKLGAKKVYLVEPQSLIHTVKNIVKQNQLGGIVECLQGTAETVELPETVDIITSCFTGNFLLGEDLLPSLFLARDKFLKPDGVLLPDSGTMFAVPVTVPNVYKRRIKIFSKPHLGIDYSYYRKLAANNTYKQRNINQDNYLAKPASIQTVDFYKSDTANCDSSVDFEIGKNTTCHGFTGWFDITLGSQILSTAPEAPPVHWSPLWFPVDPPINLKQGETLTIRVKKPQSGPWSWVVKTKTLKRSHSMFLLNMAEKKGGKKLSSIKKARTKKR